MTARRLRYAVLSAALVAAGTYLFVYLYRWEFHRALIAGVIFLAAEIALGLAAVLERLGRIEQRLSRTTTSDDVERVLGRVRDAAPEPRRPFAWLTDDTSLPVFVPILLGAGVVLSGLAWLVERIARATAAPVLERGLTARLAPLSLPRGVLTGAGVPAPIPTAARRRRRIPQLVAIAALAIVLTWGVDGLGDLTQDRPDRVPTESASVVSLRVQSRTLHDDGGEVTVAQTVWSACTSQLRRSAVPEMIPLGGGRVEAVVRPALGPAAVTRLRGCLQDATVDRLRVQLTAVRDVTPSGD